MSLPLETTLAHLRALVGFDTRNPPRAIAGSGGVFDYLRAALPGFRLVIDDLGDGCVTCLALRGDPSLVFNFHLDTVPAGPGWSRDPLELEVTGEHAIGLGACDTKGSAACMLNAAAATSGDVALLFSSDEEAGDSRCIRRFLANGPRFAAAVIAEPTAAHAVLAHRGYVGVKAEFRGIGGHASAARALDDSAVHRGLAWAHRAVEYARAHEESEFGSLRGIRFNIGLIEGGIKANMIAERANLRFGFRPLPSQDPEQMLDRLRALSTDEAVARWTPTFLGPTLPAGDADAALPRARRLAETLGLPVGDAVDFWSEASLFSAAGIDALVYGAGDIAQAHVPDEWVALAQLQSVADAYARIIDS